MTLYAWLALWAVFSLGFFLGGTYSVHMMARKMERSDERMHLLRDALYGEDL